MTEPLVTAIVSTWSAERYLRGCLDDLLAQTIGPALEILVIDACSPENEAAIVREYQQRHGNIRYLRTATRENSSLVFNRGAELARGRYLTTANTDDRHRPDFCARMAEVLDRHPEFGLVYADSLITRRDNETFAHHSARRRYAWPDYTHTTALSCCLFGAQPLWRRSAHARAGRWDPGHPRANDQDMFLRIAWRHGAVHLRETLGLFLQRRDSVSGADHRQQTLDDVLAVLRKYRTAMPLEDLFPGLRACGGDPLARAAALFELGNLCALGPYTDGRLALDCYRRAVEVPLDEVDGARVRAAFANNTACVFAGAAEVDAAARAWQLGGDLPEAAQNARAAQAAAARGERPRLRDFAFVELPHAVVAASRRTRGLSIDPAGGLRWSDEREQLPWDVFDGPNGVPVAAERACVLPSSPPLVTATPPHVLLVMYGWADSGGGTMLPRQVAKELAARGHRVSVFYAAARPQPELPAYGLLHAHEEGVELHGLCNRPALFMDLHAPEREIDDPRVRAVFAALLDELSPDVVHFYNLHNLGMSLPGLCKARGLPTVLSSNNYWPICPRLYLASERLQLCSGPSDDGRKCEACLGQTGTARGHAARRHAALALLNEQIDVHLATSHRVRDLYLHNGADPARIRVLLQQPPSTGELWRRTGSRRALVPHLDRPLRVAFLGSVMPHKGVHVLVAALQQLPPGTIEAVAIGDVQRDYLPFLQQLDARQALGFCGAYAQQHLPEMLARIDIVVVPSVWEDCAPLVVAEALAARAPVIASRIGGIPDFLVEGVTGMLFTPGSAAELAHCLAAFHADRSLLGRMQHAIQAPAGFGAHIDEVVAVYAALRAARLPVNAAAMAH